MRNFVFALLLMTFNASGAQLGKMRILGTVVKFDQKIVELKTPHNTLLVPRELINQPNLQVNEAVEVMVDEKEMNQIKIKK
jgi:hypothetical protein